jgi:hypothetical protein
VTLSQCINSQTKAVRGFNHGGKGLHHLAAVRCAGWAAGSDLCCCWDQYPHCCCSWLCLPFPNPCAQALPPARHVLSALLCCRDSALAGMSALPIDQHKDEAGCHLDLWRQEGHRKIKES